MVSLEAASPEPNISTAMANEYDLIIVNGITVTDTEISECDVAIKGEKIVKIVPRGGLQDARAGETIDAEGGYVMVQGINPLH